MARIHIIASDDVAWQRTDELVAPATAAVMSRAEREASATRAAYEAHFSEAAYCARLASIAAPLIS